MTWFRKRKAAQGFKPNRIKVGRRNYSLRIRQSGNILFEDTFKKKVGEIDGEKDQLQWVYCQLIVNNENFPFPQFEDFLKAVDTDSDFQARLFIALKNDIEEKEAKETSVKKKARM